MDEFENTPVQLNTSDLKVVWFSGTGKGGQHRNKHQNSCRVTHLPTGICETRQSREKEANLKSAVEAIQKRLNEHANDEAKADQSSLRHRQVGSGMRGDKTVTIRFQDDTAKNHLSGKQITAKQYMRGEMDKLW